MAPLEHKLRRGFCITFEVIQVMLEVGSAMPTSHRETAKGGLAQTPTGKKNSRANPASSNIAM
jgi:L-serine dehydratase